MKFPIAEIEGLIPTERVLSLRAKTLNEPRYLSVDQARLITESYRDTEGQSRILRRAQAFSHVARHIPLSIDPEEIIVGNRTPTSRAGVVFPEAAVEWLDREIDTLPTREQDRFQVREEDVRVFRTEILPYWRGNTLEDSVADRLGVQIAEIAKAVKINQKDHAQGHIIPNTQTWLKRGPAGLLKQLDEKKARRDPIQSDFDKAAIIVLEAACLFIDRYAQQARQAGLSDIADVCVALATRPPRTFRESVQSVWFLFVLLHLESNASSFSPGRLDQILSPFLEKDLDEGQMTLSEALEIIEALWIKLNQVVYMRNSDGARYFAGFPIGFNIAVGGRDQYGEDQTRHLSFLMLKAQEHIGLPQPNLSARLHSGSPDAFLQACIRVIGRGSGMPQVFNDEAVIPALEAQGLPSDAVADYAVVGCVELSLQGNFLGWSDAAMVNLVKILELTLNGGRCLVTGDRIGLDGDTLPDFSTYPDLETALDRQVEHFVERMVHLSNQVDRIHAEIIPSPFLSSVIDDCLEKGLDVTAGGARHNLSGVQGIQVANIADSLAVIKKGVFEEGSLDPSELLAALRSDFAGNEELRQRVINGYPKYGNDVQWVDEIGAQWATRFNQIVSAHTNARGGRYHTGFYTVSAHVPMGRNVGATPDGRHSGAPLADGGLSAMAGRDLHGPTALLRSVARIDSRLGSNGTLLNMKFLPSFFSTEEDRRKFAALLRTLVELGIIHAQFNVVSRESLVQAQLMPEEYRSLTIRVAGYTAYFTELADELQDEIIARTEYGG